MRKTTAEKENRPIDHLALKDSINLENMDTSDHFYPQ